ncbi:hypothetical protein CN171_35845 [Sinorhizobium meliloti]|nr:hypothetical protein CN171_35845 [Sinorhizobium meliloti]
MKLLRPTHPGLSTKMSRLRGRAPSGERCRSGVPHGHVWTYMDPARLQQSAGSGSMVTTADVYPAS